MIVTQRPHDNKRNVLLICLEDEPWHAVDKTLFGRNLTLPSAVSSVEELQQLFQELEYRVAKAFALKRLAMKAYLSQELRNHLQLKLITPETISKIIAECQQLGYLDDAYILQSFVQAQINRNKGPQAIIAALRKKGLSQKSAEEALSKAYEGDSQKNAIEAVIKKRYKNIDLNDPKARQKLFQALARRGFDFDEIRQVIEIL